MENISFDRPELRPRSPARPERPAARPRHQARRPAPARASAPARPRAPAADPAGQRRAPFRWHHCGKTGEISRWCHQTSPSSHQTRSGSVGDRCGAGHRGAAGRDGRVSGESEPAGCPRCPWSRRRRHRPEFRCRWWSPRWWGTWVPVVGLVGGWWDSSSRLVWARRGGLVVTPHGWNAPEAVGHAQFLELFAAHVRGRGGQERPAVVAPRVQLDVSARAGDEQELWIALADHRAPADGSSTKPGVQRSAALGGRSWWAWSGWGCCAWSR